VSDTIHTIPVNDLIEHTTDGRDCPCGPTTEPVEREDGSMGWIVLHHSLDGREHDEPDHDAANCPSCRSRLASGEGHCSQTALGTEPNRLAPGEGQWAE
jgi:hypothetical protein